MYLVQCTLLFINYLRTLSKSLCTTRRCAIKFFLVLSINGGKNISKKNTISYYTPYLTFYLNLYIIKKRLELEMKLQWKQEMSMSLSQRNHTKNKQFKEKTLISNFTIPLMLIKRKIVSPFSWIWLRNGNRNGSSCGSD